MDKNFIDSARIAALAESINAEFYQCYKTELDQLARLIEIEGQDLTVRTAENANT